MTDIDRQKTQLQRVAALTEERNEILSLSPEKALNRVLLHAQPAALVHSFPEEDLYLLIHDIGPEDALPILSLASGRQLGFILDQEIWEKDRIDPMAVANWLDLMMKAEPVRFLKWLTVEQTGLLEFFLYKNIDVKIREHDQDPSEFGEDYFSNDDVHYIRLLPPEENNVETTGGTDQDGPDEKRTDLIKKILDGLAAMDFTSFVNIILESVALMPAEAEEEQFRIRNIRLAEKGFLPFDEAVGIYQPITAEKIFRTPYTVDKKKYSKDRMVATPATPLRLLSGDNTFSRALAAAAADDRFSRLQTEFAALCNQMIVADRKKIKDRKMLGEIVRKACSFIAMGLETMIADDEKPDTATNLILKYPVADIFRVGYGRIAALKQQAEKWVTGSWFSKQGLSLNFWGETWLGVLGGLLIKKPLFFDNYKTGVLYREFESLDELEQSAKTLGHIMVFDRLLSHTDFRIPPSAAPTEAMDYKNLVLTIWVRHYLGLSDEAAPIALDQFRNFFGDLWRKQTESKQTKSNQNKSKQTGPKKIAAAMKASFLSFLAGKTGLEASDITDEVGSILESLLREIETDFGDVSLQDLDVRYIRLFLVE
jgi:hypothetical protein